VADEEHLQAAMTIRELLASYREHEDLISIGAYRRGSNKLVDVAVEMQDELNRFLRQAVQQPSNIEDARAKLIQLHKQITARLNAQPQKQGPNI
jgi:flagellum-specific ATP synthase